ncbi:class E sortase [Streptomyces sp. NPDC002490]|uniref:class E sortase n=1 Tax=Streptomyces sp. NPDC002490 TaxID=3154416 RepID=UPI00332DE4DC
MTAVRPERDSGPVDPGGRPTAPYGDPGHGQFSYEAPQGAPEPAAPWGAADGFEAAVRDLADPLYDPLPESSFGYGTTYGTGAQSLPGEWYDPQGYARDWGGTPGPEPAPYDPVPGGAGWPAAPAPPYPGQYPLDGQPYGVQHPGGPHGVAPTAYAPSPVPVDTPPPQPYAPHPPLGDHPGAGTPPHGSAAAYGPSSGLVEPAADAYERYTGGDARPAAGDRHGREDDHGAYDDHEDAYDEDDEDGDEGAAPLSRAEARRAARARKPTVGVIVSRGLGELFITVGVLMLLFVTYQLWWTNVRAQAQANGAADRIQEDWAKGERAPGSFEPGQGFALMHIPTLDVVVPVAEGIDKDKVLDRGMVGHYAEGSLKTAMPQDKVGNFAVAGHRNTHGEPFRYINRLKPGDPIVVETQDTYFVYKMASILPQTPPSNVAVLDPVPPGSGFTEPGRYVTLTTCTPEFTSKYRLIVWGKMAEERPRSQGKPDALVD